MQIDIYVEKRCIDIWIGSRESTPDICMIRQQFPNYDIALLHSGAGNLETLTAELLKANL